MSEQLHSHDQEAISCTHVIEDGKPVLYVCHDDDGSWQYLCGELHENDPGSCLIVCNGCLRSNDPTLIGIETLPIGHCAERTTPNQNTWEVYELNRSPDVQNKSEIFDRIASFGRKLLGRKP